MQRKVNALLSIIMLVFFLPAILGFTLIDHHCTGCQSHDKETTFLLSAHTHDDASCFCTEATTEDASHDCEPQQGTCNGDHSSEKHSHDCVVELKKLEAPFTPATFDNWLPTPIENSFAALFFSDNQVPLESYSTNSAPLLLSPPRLLTGYERLIRNEVFRL